MSMRASLQKITVEKLSELISNPDEIESVMFNDNTFDIDESWHGIHFILNDDLWDGKTPLRFAVMGNEEIGEDMGYGPVRYLTPEEVKEVSELLLKIDVEMFKKGFDAEKFKKAEIFPSIWDDDDALDYLVEHYKSLVKYYQEAAEGNYALLLVTT